MIKVKCIKSERFVIKDTEYLIGGIISNSNKVVLMTLQKTIVSGNYDMTKIFGIEKDELINQITNDAVKAGEDIYTELKQKGL